MLNVSLVKDSHLLLKLKFKKSKQWNFIIGLRTRHYSISLKVNNSNLERMIKKLVCFFFQKEGGTPDFT